VGFIQVIQHRTSKIDEMRSIAEQAQADAGDESNVRRAIVCEDRDNPGQYFVLVFFDSYEAAMQNSELPSTQEMSQKMMALADGPPTFYNLDIIDDQTRT
jgi:hypothetical protein